jgi:hypothetical protein
MSRSLLIAEAAFAVVSLSGRAALADEGLWTFDNFPTAAVKAKYGVTIDQAWLDRVHHAAVRLSTGFSASDGRLNRGVTVSTAAITEALEKVYRDDGLVNKLRPAQ